METKATQIRPVFNKRMLFAALIPAILFALICVFCGELRQSGSFVGLAWTDGLRFFLLTLLFGAILAVLFMLLNRQAERCPKGEKVLSLQLVDIWSDGLKAVRVIGFIVTSLLMMLFRNNGIYTLLLLLPFAIWWMQKGKGKVAILLISCITLYLLAGPGSKHPLHVGRLQYRTRTLCQSAGIVQERWHDFP